MLTNFSALVDSVGFFRQTFEVFCKLQGIIVDHKSVDATKFTQISHDILGGKATISRLKPSGDVWQFRMWIDARDPIEVCDQAL